METIELGLSMVWTKGSTTEAIFRPLTARLESASVGGARMAVDLRSSTGDVAVLPALVRFNDPTGAWGTPVALVSGSTPTWLTATGMHYMDELRDLRTILAGDRFLMLGVLVRNATGSTRGIATVGGVLDIVGWSP